MLTDNNQIFVNWFVIIHHLTKVSAQIIQCIIFERNELSITLSTLWLHVVPWSHIGILTPGITSQYGRTFVPLSVSLWNDLSDPIFDGVGMAGLTSRECFFIGPSWSIPTLVFYYFSFSLLPVYRLVLWGWGLRTDRVYITLSQPFTELKTGANEGMMELPTISWYRTMKDRIKCFLINVQNNGVNSIIKKKERKIQNNEKSLP